MTGEEIGAFRDRLMNAIVVAAMPDVTSLAPIEGEAGTISVEFADGRELFIEIQTPGGAR